MDQYSVQGHLGDGAFSEVFKAKSVGGRTVAIKCMKKTYSSVQKVKSLKQIVVLKSNVHENIIKLIQVLYDQETCKLALVFEAMDCNLYQFLKDTRPHPQKLKAVMFSVLKAIDFIHRRGVFHRDIKPQNILLKGDTVKLADFGSCKGMNLLPPFTQYISTRWYRAPQCLMTDGYYDHKMDLWSFGCVLFQLITGNPLFPGSSQTDQVRRINYVLGTPKPELIQRFKRHAARVYLPTLDFKPRKGVGLRRIYQRLENDVHDLLMRLLELDPLDRITAAEALRHPFFLQVHEKQMLRPNGLVLRLGAIGKKAKKKSEQKFPPIHSKSVQPGKGQYFLTKLNLRKSQGNLKKQKLEYFLQGKSAIK